MSTAEEQPEGPREAAAAGNQEQRAESRTRAVSAATRSSGAASRRTRKTAAGRKTAAARKTEAASTRATSQRARTARNGEGTGPPPTEKPVASRRRVSQYVVSVDDSTGLIVKIEKLDDTGNTRTELTPNEYAAAYSHAYYTAPYYASCAAALYDPLSSPAAQAYLKSIADYAKNFSARL